MAHTEQQIGKLTTAIAQNMGARHELEQLIRQLDRMRIAGGAEQVRSGQRMQRWATLTAVIKIAESRLEELSKEGREQDCLFFSWMDEAIAVTRH